MTSKAVIKAAWICALAVIAWVAPTAQGQIYRDGKGSQRLRWLEMKHDYPRADPKIQKYAQCITYALIDELPDEYRDLDWEVIVFDTGQTNAEAMADGKVAIYSGILDVANTPDKLAVVIGHELAHVTQGHLNSRVLRGAMTGVTGVVGGVLTGLPNSSQAASDVLLQKPFEREQEREADLVGMKYAAEAGYNPGAVLGLWHDMADGDRKNRPPEWLTNHPDPEYRLQFLAQNLAPALKLYNDALDEGVRPRCHL